MIADMTMVERFERMVRSCVPDLKSSSNGSYLGTCPHPDHQDDKPSFSVTFPKLLYNCFGCPFGGDAATFAKFVGDDPRTYYRNNTLPKTGGGQAVVKQPKNSEETGELQGKSCRKAEAIKRWDLVSHNGKKVPENWNMKAIKALKVGYSKQEGAIAFPILDNDGNWIECYLHKPKNKFLGGGKFKCCLYPLHLIPKYKPDVVTYVVEGMKDAVTMLSQGLQVITSTNGALNIPSDLFPIKHLKLFTHIPDYDEAGYKGQVKWAEALKEACPHAKVHITDWDRLKESFPNGTDVTDVTSVTLGALISTETLYKRGFTTMTLNEMLNTKMHLPTYLIDGLLIEKGVFLVAGTDETGKSFLATQLGLSLTTGIPFMGYFEVLKTAPVLHINFELEDGEVQRRLRSQASHYRIDLANVSTSKPFIFSNRDESEIFTDKWEYIEYTLQDHQFEGGVCIVDNLYSSTDKNLSDNDELKMVLRKIESLKQKYGISVALFAHFVKTESGTPLAKESIQGGKMLTNWVNNVLLLGRSTLNTELIMGKIMKTRVGKNALSGIPFKMIFDNDTLVFTKGGIIQNEKAHLQTATSKTEIEVLKRFRSNCIPHKDYPDNDIITIDDYYQEMVNHLGYEPTKRTAFNWISKLMDWGLVKKVAHSLYEIVWSEMDDV